MDTRTEKVNKIICSQCKGNGYVRILVEEGSDALIADCHKCDNQGEIFETHK